MFSEQHPPCAQGTARVQWMRAARQCLSTIHTVHLPFGICSAEQSIPLLHCRTRAAAHSEGRQLLRQIVESSSSKPMPGITCWRL
jgi:hypothetical protein